MTEKTHMNHKPIFHQDLVLLDVQAPDKWTVIKEMVEALMREPELAEDPALGGNRLMEAVFDREKERPTGLGNGFAFPHARIPGLGCLALCVAMLKTPVDFEAPDGDPSTLVALMAVPEEQPQLALKVMAHFAQLLSNPPEREFLGSLHDPALLAGYLKHRVLGIEASITARDIMRRPRADIYPDTPLREVTRIMLRHQLEAIAVVERDGAIVGEITCRHLFKLGMPDFFNQLKSISFIRDFDPFEKYFAEEGKSLARDVMSTDYAAVSEDTTLLEVLFELAVRGRPKVHVVRDGKRIGAIDQLLVLDRVINL